MVKLRTLSYLVLAVLALTSIGCPLLNGDGGATYTLTMEEPTGHGTVTPSPGAHPYSAAASATLTAEPAPGWYFRHWEGNVEEKDEAQTEIYIDGNETVRAVFVSSSTVVLRPALDTAIAKSEQYEPHEFFWVEYWGEDADLKTNGYLHFDVHYHLPELAADIVVHSAKLRLLIHTTEIATGSVGVFQVLEPWDEDTTWDQRPVVSANPSDSLEFEEFFAEDEWLEWDVTDIVHQWMNQEAEDYGVRVGHVFPDDFFGFEFWSSRSPDAAQHPQLVIRYSEIP